MIIVLNGPLGIGKSTLAEALTESLDGCVMLDGDRLLAVSPAHPAPLEHLRLPSPGATELAFVGRTWKWRDEECECCVGGWGVPRPRIPFFPSPGWVPHDGVFAGTDALRIMQTSLDDLIASDHCAPFRGR